MARWVRSEATIAFALYTILALIFTYPLVSHLTSRILGDGDAWLFTWNMWFMRFSLMQLKNPFCTDYIHFPTGVCSYLHGWNFTNTFAAVPLQTFFSTVTLYNLFALLSFSLAALGMFRLARLLGIGKIGAFVAGIAYSFSPYHFAHARGHLNLVSYQWIPFFVASFWTTARQEWKTRKIVICALWLTAVALTDWYYFIFCLFAMGIAAAAAGENRKAFVAILRGSAQIIALSLVFMSPLLVMMLRLAREGVLQDRVSRWYSADLQSFLIPGPISSYGLWFARWNSSWTGGPAELGTFIPWSVLLLAVLGWKWVDSHNRRWLTVWILIFFVLSLGPFLHIGGRLYDSVLLPFGWIEKLPGLDMMRAPIRFHVMTYLGICVLYGAAVNRLCVSAVIPGRTSHHRGTEATEDSQSFTSGQHARKQADSPLRVRSPAGQDAARIFSHLPKAAALGLLVLAESASLPLQTASQDISPFYRQLSQSPRSGALIDLHYNHRALFYQTIHHKKIMGSYGMLSRQPNYALDFLRYTPSVKQLVEENVWKSVKNGWPSQVIKQEFAQLPEDFTLIAIGYLSPPARLRVVTLQPHQLCIGDSEVSHGESTDSELDLKSGEAKQLLRLKTWMHRQDLQTSKTPVRIYLNDVELSPDSEAKCGECAHHVEPVTDLGDNRRTGLTHLFYANTPESLIDAPLAVSRLQQMGFEWIVVPFYGNDHFVRESLKLRPSFQDRWLEAFSLSGR